MAIDFTPQIDFEPEQPVQQESVTKNIAQEALKSSLGSPEIFNQPLPLAESATPLGAIKGGAQAALQTITNPSGIGASVSQPGKVAGEATSEKLQQEGVNPIVAKAAGFATSLALDPQTYILGAEINPKQIAEVAQQKASGLKDLISNIFTKPATDEELASVTKTAQEAIINARKSVGQKLGEMRGTNQNALDRLSDIAEKGTNPEYTPQEVAQMHKEYFSSRAPKMEETGMTVPTGVEKPKIEVYNKGVQKDRLGNPVQTIWGVRGNPEEISKLGYGPDPGSIPENILKQHGLLPEVSVSGPQFESPKEELDHLLKMRSAMYNQISKKTLDQSGNIVKAVSGEDERAFQAGIKQINNRIGELPSGDAIRTQEKKFSDIAGIYDDLQNKLKEPNQSQEFLRKIFLNPKGINKDYINKLAQADELMGTDVVPQLQKAFQSAKGLTYEQLKHPIASSLRSIIPQIGGLTRGTTKISAPIAGIIGRGIQTPFNTPEMQSLRDRLNNANNQ